ncbi:purine-nucleoside phosphorylase [Tyzzerella sp. OttesenSCG-928-J15]|nr:purine-nucleoside phosphorylase [Tyzzerella sp. OttesenSCG-928-J15]
MIMVPTPHIEAKMGEIAKTVLMPGDPLRAKFVAETFLEDAKQYNGVRGMLGFTGKYKGVPVSVQGSGMGIPSMGIYSYELYNFYGVENIIRIGTAGAMQENIKVRDIVIAQGACTNSDYQKQYGLPGYYAPIASYDLLEKCVNAAKEKKVNYHVGNVLSSDTFYDDDKEANIKWRKMGVMCVEMETAGLYMNAVRAGKNALGIFTISDSLVTGEATTSAERQTAFTDMMEIALETASTGLHQL